MNSFKRNLIFAFIAQGTSTFISIFVSLILPKVMGVESFAYWQLFVFYSGYVGFFHFGLSDGLYLKYGGEEMCNMNKELIGSQLYMMLSWLIVIAIGSLSTIYLFENDNERLFVWILVLVYLIVANLTWFMGYVFQAANQTNIHSIATIVSKCTFFIMLAIMFVFKEDRFQVYIILFVIAQTVAMIYILYQGREFLLIKIHRFSVIANEIKDNMKNGLNLTFSNIASSLVLGVGRAFIDNKWDIILFSIVSLSISMVNFVLQFITQISMVMFPALRALHSDSQKKVYLLIRKYLGVLLCGCLLLYGPLRYVLTWWLPEYEESVRYLGVLLPICVFDGKMQILYSTYMKVLRKEKLLMYINILSCLLIFALSITLTCIYDSVMVVIFAMLGTIIIRSLISGFILSKILEISYEINIGLELMLVVMFICFNLNLSAINSFVMYLITYIVVLYCCKLYVVEFFMIIKENVKARKKE